ncbi:MAG: rhodanese-related sulfurtransferase [Candidatus Saccharimonadales bacterium]
MQKIILFYKFAPLVDPEAIKLWQKSICNSLILKGRIIISEQGINGTLGGDIKDLKTYIKEYKTYGPLKTTVFKWSEGRAEDFPRLSVKVRDEIVTFGVADKIKVDKSGIIGGGKRLKPKQLHQLMEKKGSEVIFFDGRNNYESSVGRFKNAITPNVRHSRDFPAELVKPKYDKLKNKTVVTYCTGGIRCEVLTALMKQNGFNDVYQLDGGIIKYGQEYGDNGFWEGSLYVFDGRMGANFTPNSKDIGICSHCGKSTSNYENCANKACNDLVLICIDCKTTKRFCVSHSSSAKQLVK